MRKTLVLLILLFAASAAAYAINTLAAGKLPKCSMTYCRAAGCSAAELCVSGAHVKTCADVCNSR